MVETRAQFVARRGYDPADFSRAPEGGPVVRFFPVVIPRGFVPSDVDGDGADRRWDRKLCPGQSPDDGYRPRWGAGFWAARGEHLHAAVDIMAGEGAAVIAPSDGTIPYRVRVSRKDRPGAGTSPKGGNYLFVRSGRWEWYLSHLRDPPFLQPGASVRAGELLGYVGRTGNASRRYRDGSIRGCPHLHLRLGYVLRSGGVRKYDSVPLLRPLYDAGGWRLTQPLDSAETCT